MHIDVPVVSMDCKNLKVIKFFNLLILVLYLLSSPRLVFTDYKVNFPWTICIALALPSINAQLIYVQPLPQNVTIFHKVL